jgi:hypothetical protein
MVNKRFNNKSKKTSRNSKKRLNKSNKRSKSNKQKGGISPSCITSPNLSKYMQTSCSSVNLHNTNPEANYKLINGTGALPNMKGGFKSSSPLTFTDYLTNVSDEINGGGNTVNSNFDTTNLETNMAKADGFPQSGGSGFSINPEEIIGGLPGRAKYDSCCQPALKNGTLMQGKGTQALCGSQMGGKKKKHKKKSRSIKNKKHKKTKKAYRKHMAKLKKGKKGKTLKGGNPAKYPFNGDDSNFNDNMLTRKFDGKQPLWSVDNI